MYGRIGHKKQQKYTKYNLKDRTQRRGKIFELIKNNNTIHLDAIFEKEMLSQCSKKNNLGLFEGIVLNKYV